MGLISGFRSIVVCIVIIGVAAGGFKLWLAGVKSDVRAKAVSQIVEQVNTDTTQKVQSHEKVIKSNFDDVPDPIASRVDRMLQSETNSNGNRLFGTQGSARPAGRRKPKRPSRDVGLGASGQLSDQEINFIANNPELLQ